MPAVDVDIDSEDSDTEDIVRAVVEYLQEENLLALDETDRERQPGGDGQADTKTAPVAEVETAPVKGATGREFY